LELVDAVGKNYFNYPANIPFLMECLADKDTEVRVEAALFLGEGRGVGTLAKESSDVVQALGKALNDKEAKVRAQAALSLSYHGVAARAQVPALLICLHDQDSGTRACAAKALKQLDHDATASAMVLNVPSSVVSLK
jgi:HEAT repeat protein